MTPQDLIDADALLAAARVLMRRCKRSLRRDVFVSSLRKWANQIEKGDL